MPESQPLTLFSSHFLRAYGYALRSLPFALGSLFTNKKSNPGIPDAALTEKTISSIHPLLSSTPKKQSSLYSAPSTCVTQFPIHPTILIISTPFNSEGQRSVFNRGLPRLSKRSGNAATRCPAVPRAIPKDSEAYFTGVGPVDRTGVANPSFS